jgi:hypothetical protein
MPTNPFTAKIESALTDRVTEIEVRLLMSDRQYQELNTKISEIQDRIGQILLPGEERLLFELDKAWIERSILAYRRMYKQGFKDGRAANRVLRMVGRSCRE